MPFSKLKLCGERCFMRIGFYCGRHADHGGGIALYASSLLKGYLSILRQPEGQQDQLFIYAESTVLSSDMLAAIDTSGLRGEQARIFLRKLPAFAGRKVGLFLDQCVIPYWAARDRLDLLHSTSNFGIIALACPQVISVHDLYQAWPAADSDEIGFRSRLHQLVYRLLFRLQFSRSFHFLTDSPTISKEILSRFRISPQAVSSIALGIDPALEQFLNTAVHSEDIESELTDWFSSRGITPGYVLMFASSDPRKNLRRTLTAWRQLPHAMQNGGLVIRRLDAAVDAIVEPLLSSVRTEQLRIHMLDWLDRRELFFLFIGARCALLPTLAEGYGLPAIEAVSLQCPVISSRLDCLTSAAAADKVVFCDPASGESISAALLSTLESSPPTAALLSQRLARLRASETETGRKRNSISAAAAQTYSVYRQILSGEE
jgi:glycosyltransferase involved in cell wall biosynthesis